MIDRKYTPEELSTVIAQVEELLGQRLDSLVKRHQRSAASANPPKHPHRLVELLLRLRRAVDKPDDAQANDSGAVAIVEASAIVGLASAWCNDPSWSEFQEQIREPHSYLHAVTTLSVADVLKKRHPRTRVIPSSSAGASADLRMVVSDDHALDVEVKTSSALGSRPRPMSVSVALDFLTTALREARRGGQLKDDHPGLFVVGGFHIDTDTFKALGDAAGLLLERGRPRSQLLAIVISHIRFMPTERQDGHVFVSLAHHTRTRSNRRYEGNVRFVGDWWGEWRLELTSRATRP